MENNISTKPAPGEKEIWKVSKSYPEYEVSSFGNVRRYLTKTLLTPNYNSTHCYGRVHLHVGIANKNGKHVRIHRLVAEMFLPENVENKEQIDHIDRDRANNYYGNLRWATPVENAGNRTLNKCSHIFKDKTPMCLINTETQELIKRFSSPREASEELGISLQGIVDCAHKKRKPYQIGTFITEKDFLKLQEQKFD